MKTKTRTSPTPPKSSPKERTSGFTLLEILLVVGIIALLAGIVIVAINPARQLALVRNTERRSDIKQIDSAVTQYYIDHGYYPASTTDITTLKEICDTGASSSPSGADCGSLVDLSELVPTYITAIPKDPEGPILTLLYHLITPALAATNGTGYDIMRDTTNKIILKAERAELGAFIAIGTSTATSTGGGGTLGDRLVLHYKMNDTDGLTAVDDAGGHTGNGTYDIATAKTGTGAVQFGSGQEIVATDYKGITGTGDMSIAFWIKAAPTGDPDYISWGSDSDWPNHFIAIMESGGKIGHWNGDGGTGFPMSVTTINDGSWYHVAFVRQSGMDSTYINGVSEGTPNTDTRDISSAYDLKIHGNAWNGPQSWGDTTTIDDFRIYSRALTQGEITELAAGTEAE